MKSALTRPGFSVSPRPNATTKAQVWLLSRQNVQNWPQICPNLDPNWRKIGPGRLQIGRIASTKRIEVSFASTKSQIWQNWANTGAREANIRPKLVVSPRRNESASFSPRRNAQIWPQSPKSGPREAKIGDFTSTKRIAVILVSTKRPILAKSGARRPNLTVSP